MAYTELKQIKGRFYKYVRESRWVNGKSLHSSKYVGPVEPVNLKHGRRRAVGGGRKPALFARALHDEEMNALKQSLASSKSFTRDCARIILLSTQRKPVKEIAKATGKEKRSVSNAIKNFNAKGLACLQRGQSTGRKPVFDKEKRTVILALASTRPNDAGEAFTTWSLPKLKRCLEKKGISISIESIRQILRKEKFRIKKSRKFQYSPDPDFVKKNSK